MHSIDFRCAAAGADLTVKDADGNAALHYAALRGEPTVVQCLLEHGAFVDTHTPQLFTPLMVALAYFRDEDKAAMQRTIEVLLAANADPNAAAPNGITVLLVALAQAGSPDSNENYQVPASVCILLIEAGQKHYGCTRCGGLNAWC